LRIIFHPLPNTLSPFYKVNLVGKLLRLFHLHVGVEK